MSVSRLNNDTVNTPEIVIGKLRAFLTEGTLRRLVVVAWLGKSDGVPVEIIIGSDDLDRADLLCASQSCRITADAIYRMRLELGKGHSPFEDDGGTMN